MNPGRRSLVLLGALLPLALLAGCDRFKSPGTRLAEADAAMKTGDYGAAVVQLKNALDDEPGNDQAHLLLAEAALWLGDARGAQSELGKIKGDVDRVRLARVDALLLLAQGKNEELLGQLGDSPLPPAQREQFRGQALMQLQRYADAQRAYEAAVAADPALAAAAAGVLDARAAQGDRPGALAGFEALTGTHPDSAQVWLSYGLNLAAATKFDEAVKALNRARELGKQLRLSQQVSLYAALCETHLQRGDPTAAGEAATALGRVAPEAPLSAMAASRVAMAKGDYAAAVSRLRKLVQSAPRYVEARMLLSMAHLAEGNAQQASVELNNVITQAPSHTGARQLLAQIRLQLDNPDGALRMLAPALENSPGDQNVNALIEAARSKLGAEASVTLLEDMLGQDPDNTGLEAQLASAYVSAGQPDKAVELLRKRGGDSQDLRRAATLLKALKATQGDASVRREVAAMVAAEPANAYVANLAAATYLRLGDADASRRVLEQALERGAKPASLLLSLGQLEWSVGKREAAAAAIQKLLELEPKNAAAHMAAGEIAMTTRDFGAARRHFEAARSERPESIDARMRLAQLSLREGAGKDADKHIAEAIGLGPKRPDVHNAAGLLNLNYGRADQAIQQFRAATELDATNAGSWFNLARAQRTLGQVPAARASLEKAAAAQPGWLPPQATLALMEVAAGETDAAMARVNALKSASPKDPFVRVLAGDVLLAAHRHAEALTEYRAAYALKADGNLAAAYYRAALAGNLPKATELLERWSRAHPDDGSTRALLAEDALRRGERANATAEYRNLLARRPDDVVALNNLAWLYHEAGDARALELARKAAGLAPQNAGVLDTLGWILVERGQVAEGLEILSRAAANPKADPEIRYHHAAALARSDRRGEARRVLEELLSHSDKFPSRAAAEELLSQLQGGAGGAS